MVSLLLRRLREATSILSAQQQGAEIDDEELYDIVRDFATALLGREILIGEIIPYGVKGNSNDAGVEQFLKEKRERAKQKKLKKTRVQF